MRENSQNQGQNSQNWQQEAQIQNQMYPNLEEMINQSEFLREFFGRQQQDGSPSAPPADENVDSRACPNAEQGNAGGWSMPDQNIGNQPTRYVPGKNFCVCEPIFKILFSTESCIHVEYRD